MQIIPPDDADAPVPFWPSGPLLPPWATERMIANAGDVLASEIAHVHRQATAEAEATKRRLRMADAEADRNAPELIAEAEAMLKHEAEGW